MDKVFIKMVEYKKFTVHKADNGLISRIYKKLLQIDKTGNSIIKKKNPGK